MAVRPSPSETEELARIPSQFYRERVCFLSFHTMTNKITISFSSGKIVPFAKISTKHDHQNNLSIN
jgi:hypothetical protein